MVHEHRIANRLELSVPPVVVLLLFALLMWAVARWVPSGGLTSEFWRGLAMAMLGLSTTVGTAALWSFQRAKTTMDPRAPSASTQLIRSGVFAWSRNPIYLAFALLLLAYALVLGSLWNLALVALFMMYIQRFQIRPEERCLYQLFGEAYRDYCCQVRRWI